MRTYKAQAARDAQAMNYGDESYWDYLENAAYEDHGYFRAKGDWKSADEAFTRSLSDALMGNEGE